MTNNNTTVLPPEQRNSTVAVYVSQHAAENAVRRLEAEGFDMKQLSLLARGLSEERHVIGTDTAARRTGRWAGFGSLWGLLIGAFFWVPGIGHVAVGGYLLYLLTTGALGAAGGAFAGALTSIGIPREGVLRYEADLEADKWILIAHGTTDEVERARALLAESDPERIDVHTSAVAV